MSIPLFEARNIHKSYGRGAARFDALDSVSLWVQAGESTGRLVEDILFSLNKENGITLVIVTHDPELAARCDRQLFIRDGREVRSLDQVGEAA